MGIILTILCFGVAAILYILLGGILKKFKPLNFGLFGLLFVVGALVSLYIGDNVRMTEDYDYTKWGETTMSDYLLILALGLGVIGSLLFLFAWISSEARNEDKRAEKLKEERAIRDKEEQALKVQLENHKADLTNQYGKITKEFFLPSNNNVYSIPAKEDCIFLFGEARKIWICGTIYDFKDILGCSLSDNFYLEKGEVEYKTKTSTGSMVGRAVVGGMLTGGVGAIVGGATASKKTEVIPKSCDKTIHDYTVLINVNSLDEPVRHIPCKEDATLANDLIGLFNVIVRQTLNN